MVKRNRSLKASPRESGSMAIMAVLGVLVILPVFAYQKMAKTKARITELNHLRLKDEGTSHNVSSLAIFKQIMGLNPTSQKPALTIKPLFQPGTNNVSFRPLDGSASVLWTTAGKKIRFRSGTIADVRSSSFMADALANRLKQSGFTDGEIIAIERHPTGFVSSLSLSTLTALKDKKSNERAVKHAARLPIEFPEPTCVLQATAQPGNRNLVSGSSVVMDPGVFVEVDMECVGFINDARLQINGSTAARHPQDLDTRAQADFDKTQNVFPTQRLTRVGNYLIRAQCTSASGSGCLNPIAPLSLALNAPPPPPPPPPPPGNVASNAPSGGSGGGTPAPSSSPAASGGQTVASNSPPPSGGSGGGSSGGCYASASVSGSSSSSSSGSSGGGSGNVGNVSQTGSVGNVGGGGCSASAVSTNQQTSINGNTSGSRTNSATVSNGSTTRSQRTTGSTPARASIGRP